VEGECGQPRPRSKLSVCCLTGGRRPALLAGILALLRDSADEIVVGVEEARAEAVYEAVAGIADVVESFPPSRPADKAIAWLFGACSGTWIFNIDDDEVPSPRLVAALPEIVRRTDITHGWVARRWLYPTSRTYLTEAPWGTEFQLRLALADERSLQFSDVFHRPVVCHGPSTYVDAPLWHLDSTLAPAANRRDKARAYELERPGMRVGGVAHNAGMYLPELRDEPVLAAVPEDDLRAIEAALAYRPQPAGVRRARRGRATAADLEERWTGPPYPESLYRAELSVAHRPTAMTAGIPYTVDVLVTNGSDRTWRWGPDARPEIRLAYNWTCGGSPAAEPVRLRTPLPADLPSGATQLVPLHVVAPSLPGGHELELDLIHEHVRWFGLGVSFPVEVQKRLRVAFLGPPERVPLLVADLRLGPEVEPVAIVRDLDDRSGFGDYETVEGLNGFLLEGTGGSGRVATLVRLLSRTARVALDARRPPRARRPSYAGLLELSRSTDALVVAVPSWVSEPGFARDWWVLTATALVWRLAGRRVVVGDDALPDGPGLGRACVRWALRRVRSSARY
jgi:hypothetical protein